MVPWSLGPILLSLWGKNGYVCLPPSTSQAIFKAISCYWTMKREKERRYGGCQAPISIAGSCENADCRQHPATRTALGTGRLRAGWEVRPRKGLRDPQFCSPSDEESKTQTVEGLPQGHLVSARVGIWPEGLLTSVFLKDSTGHSSRQLELGNTCPRTLIGMIRNKVLSFPKFVQLVRS